MTERGEWLIAIVVTVISRCLGPCSRHSRLRIIGVGVGSVGSLSTDRLSGSHGRCSLRTLIPALCCGMLHRVDRHRRVLPVSHVRVRAVVALAQPLRLIVHAMFGRSDGSASGSSARPTHLGQHTLWQSQYVQQYRSLLTALAGHAGQAVCVPQRLVGSTPLRLVVERHSLVQRAVL